MRGITGYAVYIPRHRLARETIAAAWGAPAAPGTKAVAHFDEDSLTLGQAAVWPLVDTGGKEALDSGGRTGGQAAVPLVDTGRKGALDSGGRTGGQAAVPLVDAGRKGALDSGGLPGGQAAVPLVDTAAAPAALYFASTTAPYWQRSAASLIAAGCDLPAQTRTADFSGSLRCGASALRAAWEGSAPTVVVASDTRQGEPESAEEMLFGDAAAAVAVGEQGVIAEIAAASSRSDDFPDEWRRDQDAWVRSSASKFSLARGYQANVVAVGKELLGQAGVEPGQVARVALASPDGRAQLAAARELGIAPGRVEDSRLADLGITGAAMPLLLLAQALERARPGDWILMVAYGDGAEGILLRATSAGPRLAPDAPTIPCPSYSIYRKLREALRGPQRPEMSNVLWEREEPQNVRLHGTWCPRCGTVSFPIAPVCGGCRNREGLGRKPLARRGRLFTYTQDYLYEAPLRPTVMAVVDLDGGGRFLCQMTDVDERPIEIGMEVELVLRRLPDMAAARHYYWKCRRV